MNKAMMITVGLTVAAVLVALFVANVVDKGRTPDEKLFGHGIASR